MKTSIKTIVLSILVILSASANAKQSWEVQCYCPVQSFSCECGLYLCNVGWFGRTCMIRDTQHCVPGNPCTWG